MPFIPRLTIPEKGNPYYNSTGAGGYAVGTIKGNPLQDGLDVLANCVGYSASRFNEILNKGKWVYLQCPPNPIEWLSFAQKQGLKTGNTPKLGSVIVWHRHVAVVEKINADGSIVTSESGYGCTNPFWITTRTNEDGNWGGGKDFNFLGFVYLPEGEVDMSDYKKKGIDISWCQPKVDWNKVNVDFVIVQVGGGYVARKEDTMYQSHYKNAKTKGIPVGAYWFIQALNETDAIEEANICVNLLKGKQFEYPIFLDMETEAQFKLSKKQFSAVVRAFLKTVEAAGYWVGLYTNLNGLLNYVEDDIKSRYSIWIAQWDVSKPTYSGAYGIWQTGVGTFAGFPDKVDADICYIDYPSQIKAKGLNGYGKEPAPTPTPTPTPTKKTIDVEMTVDGITYAGTLTEK